jgi:hypothetical protein
MSWQFNPMSPGDLNVDPFQDEFFTTEALGGITGALVREAIQNSLDAAVEEKVHVRFRLGTVEDVVRDRYLKGLWPHVRAAAPREGPSLPDPHSPLRFLLVEDEGTRGLEGDPSQDEDDDGSGGRNDFYYFWRNVGRSRKEAADRGRWGLGKTVFAAASRLRAFFGLTVRRSDSCALLMGQAVLRIHRLQGRRYRPYGYYGRHKDGFTMPLEHPPTCEEFSQSFGLHRCRPGLSIVIPYPDEDITFDSIVEAVVRHYFQPLLAGKLEVKIQDERGSCLDLRADCLDRESRRRNELRHFRPLLKLARWGVDPEQEAMAVLKPPTSGRAPKLSEDLFVQADLDRLRPRYEEGRRVALDVPLWIERKGEEPRPGKFRLLIERAAELQGGEGYFVRQGITVENPGTRRPRGVRWILLVDDPILSAFLGDAENPAHTEWQRNLPKFKEKYKLAPRTLDFVRSAPANVAALLGRPPETRDPDLLRHIFSLPSEAAGPSFQRRVVTRGGEVASAPEEVPAASLGRNGELVLDKVKAGFQLRGKVGEGAPRRLEVLAAYDVLRGNPFQRYSPLDFRMDDSIVVTPQGARVVSRQDNRLELEIEEAEFTVKVTGFDENRDLRVKIRPLEERQ